MSKFDLTKLIADCVFRGSSQTLQGIDLSDSDIKELIRIAEKNKVLLPLSNSLSGDVSAPFSTIRELCLERLRQRLKIIVQMPEKLAYVDSLFEKHGISRLYPKLSRLNREHSDIDVLVKKEDFEDATSFILSYGFRIVNQEQWKRVLFKWVDGKAFVIHLHAKIIWGIEPIPTNEIWNNTRYEALDYPTPLNVRVPSFEDSIIIWATHSIYEEREITLADLFEFLHPDSKLHDPAELSKNLERAKEWGLGEIVSVFLFILEVYAQNMLHKHIIATNHKEIFEFRKTFDSFANRLCLKNLQSLDGMPYEIPEQATGLFLIGNSVKRYGGLGIPKIPSVFLEHVIAVTQCRLTGISDWINES